MLATASVLSSACNKQKSKEEAEPTAVPSVVATPTQPPDPAPPPPATIAPPVQPPAAPVASAAAAKPESIKACCAALHKEESTASDKALYQNAADSCEAISKMVAAGKTKKAAALTQLRANIKGAKLPPGCE